MSTVQTRQVSVERFSISSSESFETVVGRIEREIGHPDVGAFLRKIGAAMSLADVEVVVREGLGSSGLMEFTRFDIGAVLRKEQGAKGRQSLRLLMGNPLIMKEMAKHVPDAGSYAPVTVLVDERDDGVHLSYDRMASLLAPYQNTEASKVAQELDLKIEALLTRAAS